MEILQERSNTEMFLSRVVWDPGLRPFHRHEKLEVIVPLERPIEVYSHGEWRTANCGDVSVIAEGDIHAFRVEEETPLLLGQFPYRILLEGGELPRGVAPLITTCELTAIPSLPEQVSAIFTAALPERRVMIGERGPVLQGLFTALYFLLSRHFPLKAEVTEKRTQRDLAAAVTYINEHFTEDITATGVAAALYTDRGRLSRLFSNIAGVSLPEYIRTLRLSRAVKLLDSGATVTAAALESGFQSVRTFHEVYRRVYGRPPKRRESKDSET